MTEQNQLLKELKALREDVNYLKKHIVDSDVLLTDDDLESLSEAKKDLREGKTKRLI